MRLTRHRRWAVPVVAAAAVGLALTACTGDIANETAADVDCADYEQYGTFDGAEVTVAGTILDVTSSFQFVYSASDESGATASATLDSAALLSGTIIDAGMRQLVRTGWMHNSKAQG